jgi:hypothetical protein
MSATTWRLPREYLGEASTDVIGAEGRSRKG